MSHLRNLNIICVTANIIKSNRNKIKETLVKQLAIILNSLSKIFV